MDIVETRRENLRRWVLKNGTPQKEKSLFSQLKANGSFGERVARRLETQYRMGAGYLDAPIDGAERVESSQVAMVPQAAELDDQAPAGPSIVTMLHRLSADEEEMIARFRLMSAEDQEMTKMFVRTRELLSPNNVLAMHKA